MNQVLINCSTKNMEKYQNFLYGNLSPDRFKKNFAFIAEGAYGRVYQCMDQVTSKKYVMKHMETSPQGSKNYEQTTKAIEDEISILEKIRNCNPKPSAITQYHGYYKKENTTLQKNGYYVFFEYVPKTLREYIKFHQTTQTIIPFSELKAIYNDLINGLAFLQSIDISHRDLKPTNILINENKQVKIIDYGLARDLDKLKNQFQPQLQHEHQPQHQHLNQPSISKFGLTIVGTLPYMSPELFSQIRTNQTGQIELNSYKSDVFSLGLILLELGSLNKIIRGDDENEQNQMPIDMQIENNLLQMKQNYQNEGVECEELIQTIEKCLKDIQDRPDFIELFQRKRKNKEKLLLQIFLDDMSSAETTEFLEKINNEQLTKNKEIEKEEQRKIKEKEKKQEVKRKLENLIKLQTEWNKLPLNEHTQFSCLSDSNQNYKITQKEIKNEKDQPVLYKSLEELNLSRLVNLRVLELKIEERVFKTKNDLLQFNEFLGKCKGLEKLILSLKNNKILYKNVIYLLGAQNCLAPFLKIYNDNLSIYGITWWNGIDEEGYLSLIKHISELVNLHFFSFDFELNSINVHAVEESKKLFENAFKELRIIKINFGRQFVKNSNNEINEFLNGNKKKIAMKMKEIFKEISIPEKMNEDIVKLVNKKDLISGL